MSEAELTNKQILIMVVTAGVCVANVYYGQPLLKDIAMSFQVQNKDAGLRSEVRPLFICIKFSPYLYEFNH